MPFPAAVQAHSENVRAVDSLMEESKVDCHGLAAVDELHATALVLEAELSRLTSELSRRRGCCVRRRALTKELQERAQAEKKSFAVVLAAAMDGQTELAEAEAKNRVLQAELDQSEDDRKALMRITEAYDAQHAAGLEEMTRARVKHAAVAAAHHSQIKDRAGPNRASRSPQSASSTEVSVKLEPALLGPIGP